LKLHAMKFSASTFKARGALFKTRRQKKKKKKKPKTQKTTQKQNPLERHDSLRGDGAPERNTTMGKSGFRISIENIADGSEKLLALPRWNKESMGKKGNTPIPLWLQVGNSKEQLARMERKKIVQKQHRILKFLRKRGSRKRRSP